ncbi:glycosyltransferase [Brevibacillus dissolubilis]|uniref:glycosyltransferase n=1 Tax=Brevibacillus dissolubilis TaxID=1844116 RepID=UPI001115F8FC|nr:glycosyltransferase [Brevibacillus dissolubilis]
MDKKPKRILHIFGGMNRGGAEMRTLDLMRNIDRSAYQFEFCALSGQPGVLDEEIRQMGGEVHLCGLGLSFPARFQALLQTGRYDVVHSHVHHFSGLILWLAARAGVKGRIAHFRSTASGQAQTLRRKVQTRVMKQLINRHATQILSVNEGAMVSSWRKDWKADPRCQVIYNGVDLLPFRAAPERHAVRQELGIAEEAQLIIHVGRMDTEAKNHLRLIELFAATAKLLPQAHLLLVGKGGNQREQQVRALIAKHQITDRVTLVGQRQDVPRLMMAADMLLLPSLWEGLPGVVLEARAAGLPVLGSDIPGTLEIAQRLPYVHCLPLAESDQVWAERISRILAEEAGKMTRTEALEQFEVSEFSIENCLRSHTAVWIQM